MNLLIKNARIFDDSVPEHLEVRDIRIEHGVITDIGKNLDIKDSKVIESQDLCISPGWLDIGAFNGEPGFEHREDLQSLKNAAASGGYVALAPFPNTFPAIDSKSQVEYLLTKNPLHTVDVFPIGCATKGGEGKELAELYDLKQAGVIAFSDGLSSKLDKNQLNRILFYLKGISSTLIIPFTTRDLSINGQINEGEVSTSLGLEGMPKVEEEIYAFEVVKMAEHTEARVHAHNLSTAEACQILSSKHSNTITSSVPFKNLVFTDTDLLDFNVQLKVLPPIRDKMERKQLITLIKKGKITVINSNHLPINEEEKDREFGRAAFGATGLEVCFRALNTYVPELKLETKIKTLSKGPYNALGLNPPCIVKGEKAVLTLFDPVPETTISAEDLSSKSSNNPFIGKTLKGIVIGVINGEKTSLSL